MKTSVAEAVAHSYGPQHPDRPHATYLPDPDFDDPAYQTYWRVQCPACGHRVVAGLPKDTEILILLPPAEVETKGGRKANQPPAPIPLKRPGSS